MAVFRTEAKHFSVDAVMLSRKGSISYVMAVSEQELSREKRFGQNHGEHRGCVQLNIIS